MSRGRSCSFCGTLKCHSVSAPYEMPRFSLTNMPGRPRVKLHKLSVYLSPSVALNAPKKLDDDQNSNQYLPSMVPQSINLLQPFEFDPRFGGKNPYLSASRITKVAPAAPPQR